MKAFELHTYSDGNWKIDSVFDNRELALYEARRVDDGSRYTRVRVIEENHDDSSDLTTTRTIFRGGTVEHIESLGHGTKPGKERATTPHRNTSNIVVPVLVLSILIVAGLTALVGLQELSQLR